LLATAAAGALVAGVGIGVASAAPVNSFLVSGSNLLSDNSAEYLIKGTDPITGTPNTTAGVVEVGDRLRGVASINTIENSASAPGEFTIGGSTANDELTILFDLTVTLKTMAGGALSGGGTCGAAFCFEFGPSAGFAAEMDAAGFGLHAGAVAGFFTDSDNDYSRQILTDIDLVTPGTQTSPASIAADLLAMEALAKDGTAFWLVGIDGVDDFWFGSTSTDNIALTSAAPLNTPFGQFAVGVSLLDRVAGPALNPILCLDPTGTFPTFTSAEFCGNGGLLSKGPTDGGILGLEHVNSAMDSFDDVNFNINVVPEPASLGLLGLGLLGLGFASRRRRNRQ
jgi:hypothetical protein